MHQIPGPAIRDLLPPLLACLPTAFVSPQPPPALLPLLSPILRQRMHLLAAGPAGHAVDPRSPSSTWLGLLTWQEDRAERLNEIVATLQLEPHPVSGELELFDEATEAHKTDAERTSYRRLDHETLQARCELPLYGLAVHWVWVESDNSAVGAEALLAGPTSANHAAEPTTEDGWKVAEVLPAEDADDNKGSTSTWRASISLADAAQTYDFSRDPSDPQQRNTQTTRSQAAPSASADEDDDDDYWNSYDRTPGASTPAAKSTAAARPGGAMFSMTPAHPERSASSAAARARAEREYFSRYGEVQPAMDNFDPDEAGQSTAQNNTKGFGPGADRDGEGQSIEAHAVRPGWEEIARARDAADLALERGRPRSRNGEGGLDGVGAATTGPELDAELSRQTTVTQDFADALARDAERKQREKLEPEPGERRRPSIVPAPVEACVKQHISYELKSLWRLARGVGVDTEEFKGIIRRELDVLELLEE